MIHFLFSVLAMPIRLIAHGAAMLRLFNPRPLLWIAWRLGQDPQDAVGVISLTAAQFGMRAAGEVAEQMFAQVPDCQIYTTLAWIEMMENNNLSAAERWLQIADEEGVFNRHTLYPVKLYLSDHGRAYDKAAILEEMLGRNDLPGEYTRDAMLGKAAMLLEKKEWSQAEQLADHILKIEELLQAVWVKWIAAVVKGDSENEDIYLDKLLSCGNPGHARAMIALGWLYMGNRREAMAALHEAQSYNANIDIFPKELVELTKTAEYYKMQESKDR